MKTDVEWDGVPQALTSLQMRQSNSQWKKGKKTIVKVEKWWLLSSTEDCVVLIKKDLY